MRASTLIMAEVKPEDEGPGKTFVEAAFHKYLDSMEEDCDVQIFVPKRGPAKVSESGDLILPRILHLTHCNISRAGDSTKTCRMCVNVCELDLMENRFSEWTEVLKVITEIPNLSFLNLTSNALGCSSVTSDPELTFPGLRQLVLNNTHVTWTCIAELLAVFPSLEELHLSLNDYTTIDVPSSLTYPSLCKLHFTGNNVVEWPEIKKLGHLFPNLVTLIFTECKLTSLGQPDEIASTFPKLCVLNINKTQLDTWEELDKLKLFPELTDVRLVGIPFFESFPQKKRRELIVARTPSIQRLNGSRVQENEREDAERAFIRHYLDDDDKPQRYYELESRHGKLDQLVNITLGPRTSYKVKVIFEDKEEEMDISTTQTVGEFKKFLSNFVGHPPSKWRLFFEDKEMECGPQHMHYLNRKLYSYNFRDGIEFIAQLKEVI